MTSTEQLDDQLLTLMPDPAVEEALAKRGGSLVDRLELILQGYAARPALGERAYDVSDGERRYRPEFTTITYDELRRRAAGLAAAWSRDEDHGVRAGEFVAILGFAGIDYFTAILASAYAHAVAVPLQTTLAGADLEGIFETTAPAAIAATVSDLAKAVELAEANPSVRTVIAFEFDERLTEDRLALTSARERLEQSSSQADLLTIHELTARGDASSWEPQRDAGGDERMAMLIHSSGSTGVPKGTVATEDYIKHRLWTRGGTPRPLVRVGFAPLNHGMGLATVTTTLTRGGTCFFTARPDLSMLLEDLGLARPTDIVFFPRVLEMIHHQYLADVARRTREGDEPDEARAAASRAIRPLLGDRVASAIVGSASTAPELKQFMSDVFGLQLIDTYGSTEAGVVIIGEHINRAAVVDYRLRDVPELGYYTTDKPHPRGEFSVKTRLRSPAYYRQPEATGRLLDEDGFLLTGDIMEELEPDRLVFIDRRNDVIKLSQGEYVAVGNLATTFESGSALIEQIYVYGNSARSYLLAVVVANRDIAEAELGAGFDASALRSLIRAELQRVAADAGLRSFEIPRDFILEDEPFTHENGLLSSAHKRLRPALGARYNERLEELYSANDRERSEEVTALMDPDNPLGTVEKVSRALAIFLGVEDIDPGQGFVDLGGDSLGAASFGGLLQDIFGVALPVSAILSPAGNPGVWAGAIEAELSQSGARVASFEAIHGSDATTVSAAQLDMRNFLDEDARKGAREVLAARSEPAVVLLTGATGFLGRFVCLEWLERLAGTDGGRLVCLVRAPNRALAEQRLAGAFATDPELERRFSELAAGRLEVLVGDVAQHDLGLEAGEFSRLARETDRIVHVGALVNHVLEYRDLFEPNVAGTAELVRLAVSERLKPIDFVSSLAVAHLLESSSINGEDSPLLESVSLSSRYGAGYAAGKWASEQLLRSAQREFGLPVNVFRGDMMLAHRHYRGQLNVPDTFTRLLLSVIASGLAPRSFYPLDAGGERRRAHYDGLPVDFVAAAVVAIGASQVHSELRTYHVTNAHDDGLSLDTFVDWIEQAGYPVHRIAEHATWLEQFESALRALPEELRRHSSLNVLGSLALMPAGLEAESGSERFQAAVRSLELPGGIPQLDRAFIEKCIDDLVYLGLITPAGPPAREVTEEVPVAS